MGTRKNFVVPGGLTIDSSTLYVDDPNNRVGVGKTNPDHELDVAGVVKASNGVVTLTTSGTPTAPLPDGAIAVDTANAKLFFRSSSSWTEVSGGAGGLTVSLTEPSPATEGDLWFKEDTGQTFVFYDSEWMEIGPPVVDSVLQRISAKGDIIVATSGNTVATLPVGTNDYFLVADSSQATGLNWKDLAETAAILKTAVDAKGDLLVGTASDTISRLAVGSNNSLLVAASGEATGLSWSTTLSGLTLTSPTVNSGTLNTPTLNNAAENYPLLKSPEEVWSISATAATGTVNVDVLTAAAFYYTSNASADWTFNFRGDGSTTLDSLLSTGTSVTVAFAVTNGGTAYRPTAFQVDGSSVTPKWQGGSAPSAGNTNSIDVYVFSLVKTGTATFTVFASQTKFA